MRKEGKFKPEPLRPAEEWVKAINKIKPQLLDITGGEPTLMPDFVDMIEKLDPTIKVAFTTNLSGSMHELVRRIRPDRVTSITVSFHPTHKGVDLNGFTAKAVDLVNAGFQVTVNYVAWPGQMDLIPMLKQHFEHKGIRFHIDPFSFVGFEYDETQKEFLKPYIEKDRLPDAQKGDLHKCSGGMDHLNIQPNGDAYRCILDKQINEEACVGNIFDEDFKPIDGETLCSHRYQCPGCDKDKVKVEKI
jgi:MoaA/NifB/PqqE/SkfB family radical SAM enzyme